MSAMMRLCDRCITTPIDDDSEATNIKVTMDLPADSDVPGEVYEVEAELCADCAKVVLGILQKMKLGPDAQAGGVRKVIRKSKAEKDGTEGGDDGAR